jgi:oxygen-dependent protoporphyrinogen oxidase
VSPTDAPEGTATTIGIVGGGLGGLLLAVELQRRGAHPLVLEASTGPGGVAGTVHADGYMLEPAASSVLWPNADLGPVLEAAGVEPVPATEAGHRRFLYQRGRLTELKQSPGLVLAPIVGPAAKLRALAEPVIRPRRTGGDESLQSFLTRRLGPELGRLGATLMAHGVFAGDPEQLSAAGTFPSLVDLEAEAGSIVRGGVRRMRQRPKGTRRATPHVIAGGMSQLADQLASALGDRFISDSPVEAVEPSADGWRLRTTRGEHQVRTAVLALAPAAAARLAPDDVATVLERATAAPVAIVGLGGPAADLPIPNGFGALVGPDADVRVLGVLFESQYATDRAPSRHRLAKAIYGGAADPSVMALDDDELTALATAELTRITGVTMDPSWSTVVRHRSGIPQYEIGHPAWLEDLDDALTGHDDLHLAGWGYRGIGLSRLAADAGLLADRIMKAG